MSLPRRVCHAIHAPDWMVIDAVRYAIGRRSYQVGETCEWLRAQWLYLNERTKAIIRRDIESEFERAERVGNFGNFGDACDLREWQSVRQLWHKERP